MKLLKRENWWIWFILLFFTSGTSTLILGALLDVFHKDAWYIRWTRKIPKWLLPALFILVFGIFFSAGIIALTLDEVAITTLTGLTAFVFFIWGILLLVISLSISIFMIQILCQTAAKLNVPGKELYLSPYVWVLCVVIPIIGWIFIPVMLLYLEIWNLVMLYRGAGENA